MLFFFSHLKVKLVMLYDKHFINNVKLLIVSSICWPGITATVGFVGAPTHEVKSYVCVLSRLMGVRKVEKCTFVLNRTSYCKCVIISTFIFGIATDYLLASYVHNFIAIATYMYIFSILKMKND